MGRTACTEPQCLYSIAIPLLPLWAVQFVQSLSACTVELYLYSPYGTYSLYRASVPVQYSYTSTPLGACTRVNFTRRRADEIVAAQRPVTPSILQCSVPY